MMEHPTFDWDTENKYNELKKCYMPHIEKTALIKNWLGRKGLQLLEMLTQAEKGKCETSIGLFKTLNDKLKP